MLSGLVQHVGEVFSGGVECRVIDLVRVGASSRHEGQRLGCNVGYWQYALLEANGTRGEGRRCLGVFGHGDGRSRRERGGRFVEDDEQDVALGVGRRTWRRDLAVGRLRGVGLDDACLLSLYDAAELRANGGMTGTLRAGQWVFVNTALTFSCLRGREERVAV